MQHYVVRDATLETDEGQAPLAISVNEGHIQAANAFLDGPLMVGLGLRLLTQSVNAKTEEVSKQIFVTTARGHPPSLEGQRLSASIDVSERHLVWGLSIGGWYPRWATFRVPRPEWGQSCEEALILRGVITTSPQKLPILVDVRHAGP